MKPPPIASLTVAALAAACAYDNPAAWSPQKNALNEGMQDVMTVALPDGARFEGLRARGQRITPLQLQAVGRSLADVDTLEVLAVSARGGADNAQRHVFPGRVVGGRRTAGGVALYRVEYRYRGVWRPLCAGATEGVLLEGSIDATTGAYTPDAGANLWACVGSATGQCAEEGYAPLGDTQTHEVVATLFASCVRAVRADYCGDGNPGARALDGTPIDIYDTLGIAAPSPAAEGFVLEAEWTPDGARCVHGSSGIANRCARPIPACEGEPRGVVTRVAP